MLFDVCVNLLNSQFNSDREAVIERAHNAGVGKLLITATNLATSTQAIVWSQPPSRWCTAGIHPHDATDLPPTWLEELTHLAQHKHVVAVGETGLDFYRNFSPRTLQIEVFDQQIGLAARLGKPLFVHDRDSKGEVYQRLQKAGDLPPVLIHCFTGTRADLEAYLAAGFYIGITGWVADPRRGDTLRELVPHIPLERLVIETDAPFLKPHNTPADFLDDHNLPAKFKRRNEPALLPRVLEAITHLRPESAAEVARATADNAAILFGLQDSA